MLVVVGAGRPGVAANLARAGVGVEAPDFLTRLGIERIDATAYAVFRARHARVDQAVVVAEGAGDAVAVVVVLELRPPDLLARLLVQRDEATVEQAREHHAFADCHAAVVP